MSPQISQFHLNFVKKICSLSCGCHTMNLGTIGPFLLFLCYITSQKHNILALIFLYENFTWFVTSIMLLLSTFVCIMTILPTIITLDLRLIVTLTLCLIQTWTLTQIFTAAPSTWAWWAASSTSVWVSSSSSSIWYSFASTLTKLKHVYWSHASMRCLSLHSVYVHEKWVMHEANPLEIMRDPLCLLCHNNGIKYCSQTSQNFVNYSPFLIWVVENHSPRNLKYIETKTNPSL